jgi:hypothetical protein
MARPPFSAASLFLSRPDEAERNPGAVVQPERPRRILLRFIQATTMLEIPDRTRIFSTAAGASA